MKIAIVNQPLGNRGDESAHKAFVRQLALCMPDIQIDVVFLGREQVLVDAMKIDSSNVRYINIPKYRLEGTVEKMSILLNSSLWLSYYHPTLRKFKEFIKSYDKILCAPGGICLGGFLSWDHLWQLMVVKELGKPIFYWGRSIGPFSDEDFSRSIFLRKSKELLKYFSYISLRDKTSMESAGKMGVKAIEVVDSAFLEEPLTDISPCIQESIGKDYVVFVPNQLTWHYRYKNVSQEHINSFYLSLIDLLGRKYPSSKIVMLPQTFKSWINDYEYFLKLKKLADNDRIVVIDENQSSDIQQSIIRHSRLVVGARYHSIVFALNNGIPFISLSYEHKMRGLLELIGGIEAMVN